MNGRARMKDSNAGADRIATMLSQQLHSPVNDDTRLTGKYDFELFWNAGPTDASESGPDLVTAVQEQLGLKLERKRGPVDVVVIDRAEKTATAN
jgi:uncharacterized protein (TIGR03435 family)